MAPGVLLGPPLALPLLSWVSIVALIFIAQGGAIAMFVYPAQYLWKRPWPPGVPRGSPGPIAALGSWVSSNVYISSVKGGGIANFDHPAPYDWKRPRSPGVIP